MSEQEFLFCKRCGRRLKTKEARERGMGKVCFEKYHMGKDTRKLFEVKDAESNSRISK